MLEVVEIVSCVIGCIAFCGAVFFLCREGKRTFKRDDELRERVVVAVEKLAEK